ncbi:MAG TPA: tetratricopeptide repeat protein, partial [Acidimicrobiales bacterium]|nr:tetratricopeptide repeat protein [Acidimicrobiales bacterium]
MSSFVGRDAELAELAGLVAAGRCVTVAGAGGLGKTRLAVAAAREAAASGRFPAGALFVPLADVGEGPAVAALALASLGLAEEPGRPPLDTLAAAVAGRRLVVVVDNCEHVLDAAARVVAVILAAAPATAILTTSREPLLVPGEVVWRAPPMEAADAARLFADRATAADPAFRLGPGDAPVLAELCRRLDGIPLAIELAAARADVLSVREIAARVGDRFRLLTGGPRTAPSRHQTLEAAVDWSYDSLAPDQRRLLDRLSVFAGAFTLEAAARVAGDGDVLDPLSSLVRRSLVVVEGRDASGSTRYRLLETVREYAAGKLRASGEDGAARDRLVAWAVAEAEDAEPRLDGPDQRRWLDRLEADHPNLRGALAAAGPGEAAVRLAAALARFWEVRGHLADGRDALRAVLGADGEVSPLLRARALNAAALLAQRQGDYAAARSRLEEALALRRQEGDRLGIAVALHGLGNLAALSRDLERARRLYEEALAAGRELGDAALLAAALDNLGWVAHVSADFPSARGYYEEALALQRRLGDVRGVALVLGQLGDLAYQQGEYARAAACHAESLELRTELGDRAGRADSLATLGHLALHDGDLEGAARRFAESLAVREELGDRAALPAAHLNLADLAVVAGDLGEARSQLERAAAAAREARDRAALAHVLVHRARVARAQDGGSAAAALALVEAAAATRELAADTVTAEWLEGAAATLAGGGEAGLAARLVGAAAALREA